MNTKVRRRLALMSRSVAFSVTALCAGLAFMPVQAAVTSISQGDPNAAQYYSVQAYAEIKSASPNYNILDEGGFRGDAGSALSPAHQSGSLSGGGSTLNYSAQSALTGFAQAKASVSMSVGNAIANGGYNTVASQGSRTQAFFISAATPGRADFNFTLSGNSSSPYGLALGRLDFLAREFTPGNGSWFDVFGSSALHADTPGNYTFTYSGSLAGALDILFYAAAGVVIQDGATVPGGADFTAFANFADTFDLVSIDLFDTQDQRITEWGLTDVASNQIVFDQDGRVQASVPEPGTLALFAGSVALLLVRFRPGQLRLKS